MLDRIKALMAVRQLSPSQFADLTSLPRPVVSHILSGRNKPSLEVAQKIMAAFPDVSIDWLLNGRGPMEVVAAEPIPGARPSVEVPTATPLPEPPPRARVAKSTRPPAQQPEPVRASQPVPTAYEAPPPPPAPSPAPSPAPFSAPSSFAAQSSPAAAPLPAAPPAVLAPPLPAVVQQVIRPDRVVRRIMVFYSDGTFSDHRPLSVDETPFF